MYGCENILYFNEDLGNLVFNCNEITLHNCNEISLLYNNAIEISGTSKFEKLNEDSTLKRKTSLQRFLSKLKRKNVYCN